MIASFPFDVFRVYSRIRIKDMPKALNGNYRKVDTPKANSYKVRVAKAW